MRPPTLTSAGDASAARAHYQHLLQVMRAADAGRAEVRLAREYVARP